VDWLPAELSNPPLTERMPFGRAEAHAFAPRMHPSL